MGEPRGGGKAASAAAPKVNQPKPVQRPATAAPSQAKVCHDFF